MLPGVDINRYAYAGNDPVNMSDPNGHEAIQRGFESIVNEAVFSYVELSEDAGIPTGRVISVDDAGNREIAVPFEPDYTPESKSDERVYLATRIVTRTGTILVGGKTPNGALAAKVKPTAALGLRSRPPVNVASKSA
jgi:hypothetical protein